MRQIEIYVQSFPVPGTRYQVSNGVGKVPHWRRDGKELFFISGGAAARNVMAVDVSISKDGSRPVSRTSCSRQVRRSRRS